MANQSPDRRAVLQMLARVAVAGQFPGFVRWAYGAPQSMEGHSMPAPAQPKLHAYQPQFFTPAEYATVDQLTELIIPADHSPGARAAGVAEFIDFMTAANTSIQPGFRSGLVWLDQRANSKHGAVFIKLPEEQQTELLREVAYRDRVGVVVNSGLLEGRQFFTLIRRYTVMGYYTSRIGLEELDDPGLKLYSQSPACPHHGDPEHKHLPSPRS